MFEHSEQCDFRLSELEVWKPTEQNRANDEVQKWDKHKTTAHFSDLNKVYCE